MMFGLFFVLARIETAYYLLRRYDVASYGVVVVDVRSHLFDSCNGRFVEGMGYSENVLRTWCLEDSVLKDSQRDMVEVFARVKNGGVIRSKDMMMQSSHGPRMARWEFERMGSKIWGRCYFIED